MAEDELVVAASFCYPHEAKMAQSLLESEGIQTFLRDEHVINAQSCLAIGGCRLMVLASALERAHEELAAQAEAGLKPENLA